MESYLSFPSTHFPLFIRFTFKDYRTIQLNFGLFRILPQSARWLLSKRRLDEGRDIIQRIAKFNDVQLKSQHLEVEFKTTDSSQHGFIATLWQLFKHKTLAVRACIVFVNW